MPFTGISDPKLPDNVKRLSAEKRRQWVGAWNGRFDQCREDGGSMGDCESSAFAVANAAVKEIGMPVREGDKAGVDFWEMMNRQISQEDAEFQPSGGLGGRPCVDCRWFVNPTGCLIVQNYPEPITAIGTSNRFEPADDMREPEPIPVVVVEEGEAELADGEKQTKREGGEDFSADAFAVVPDRERPSTWKLRLEETPGNLTVAQIGRAITALQPGGFRGNRVELTSEQRAGAIRKIGGAIRRVSGDTQQKRNLRERLDAVKERDDNILIKIPERIKDKAVEAIKSLLNPDDPDEGFDGLKLYEDSDGRLRWFMWASNRYRDRDNPPEIFEEKAHKEFVQYIDNTGDFPEAWLWHTPGTRWGVADWVDYSDGFLMYSGTVDPGMEDVAHSLASAKDMGVSHGYRYRYSDPDRGIIGWYRDYEVSPLPASKAANGWTGIDILAREVSEMGMTKAKRDFLVEHLGEDKVRRLEGKTDEMVKELDALGIDWKDVPDNDTDDPEVDSDTTKEGNTDGIDYDLIGRKAAEAITQTEGFKALGGRIDTIDERLKAVEATVTGLKETDDEKVAAKFRPRTSDVMNGYRASDADDNVKEGDEGRKTVEDRSPVNPAFAASIFGDSPREL